MSFHFSSSYFRFLLLVLFFRLCLSNNHFHDHVLCMDDERRALLDFKYGLIDETNRLASWVPEKDCCNWTGIVCDNITGHVHSIHLPATVPFDEYTTFRGDISPSLLYLKQLKHLDLSNNDFGGTRVPSFLGSLGNLRYLNLSRSGFAGTIPPQLGNLTKLRILCLGSFHDKLIDSYELTSMRNMKWLSNLRLLHHLDMSGVNLGKAAHWFQVINTLPSLAELHLSGSNLPNIHLHLASLNLTSLSLLDLSDNNFSNSYVPRWIFSTTSLVSLDLSWCNFHSMIPNSIGSFRNLTSLKFLHVPGNDFMNSSLVLQGLSSIGGNLISLDISYCGVESLVFDSLHNLTSLLSLDLRNNELTKTIPKSFGNLCNLRHFDLSGNYFLNISLTSLLESVFKCKSPRLESLFLKSTELSCHLPDQIGQLSFLRSLKLDWNHISGPIPYSIGRLSFLELLDLSNNQLNGSLPDSLGQLSNLIVLDLSSNLLTGVVTEAHFAKLTRLKYFRGMHNNLTLRPSHANWNPSFQLRVLSLNSWDLGLQFPLWLQTQRELEDLDISNTKISSTLPKHFWRLFPKLQFINMSQNQIEGRLFDIPAMLGLIDLSSNKFSGQLPQLANDSSPIILHLSNNSFVGSLHRLLCSYGHKSVESLDLAHNHLSGLIPECSLKWPRLKFLNLENNNLSGRIPRSLGSLSSLGSLNMCNNKLSGRLPVSIKNLTSLQILQLAGNELVGRIPAWFGRKLPSLKILNLRSNHFDGNITRELCHLTDIQILDLAHNNLSGDIPRCFNSFNVLSKKKKPTDNQLLFLQTGNIMGTAKLVTKGQEYTYSTILGLMMVLDLSSNNFSGSIPSELMALQALQSLNLSRNQLIGRIPENIGDLKVLESFDASLNQLSGELPMSLSRLSFLSSFNVSFNNLTGRIPSSTQLQSLNESSFFGNKLCGDPLTQSCGKVVPDRDQKEGDDGSHAADWGLIISIVLGFVVGFWAVVTPLMVGIIHKIAHFHFLRNLRHMF
ncbi:hypothetical protein OSB04_027133 [Centaurea solstitialis]|uniref:Leucine-rich repeat-containing N-terminal plant-type domain-containing protein n=1 Tax=Centaurea solstitialis TaxID=347529 RepID=A0AA38SWR6_9ASTR|nr:hypothetical protein OSB04_027133 [Centaurea solstitialis]